MSWDFSIYPEMTEAQKRTTFEAGLTLLCIQAAEHELSFMLRWVFPTDPGMNLKALYAQDSAGQKRTLGQLLNELRKRVEIQPDFKNMLLEFLELRNRFVHHLFNERDFNLATDESCVRASDVILRLQCLAWDIQRLFMGYIILWVEHCDIPELVTASQELVSTNRHLQQVRAHFQPVIQPKPRHKIKPTN
jgi:hypothetical protein